MTQPEHFFFCGIGGSGMLPLAMIMRARGAAVSGSDRALDQGRTSAKFEFLKREGVRLFPQDGSGLTDPAQILVASAAVEDTVPDVAAAARLGVDRVTRAELLARLFNAAPMSIGVGGTSGKSTTTAITAWILHASGQSPTVMNGAVMKNFVEPDAPFASALIGGEEIFISELDESDGSIALFSPSIAILHNIAHDHKSMEELRALFTAYCARARHPVINLDNDETRVIFDSFRNVASTYSIENSDADYFADRIEALPKGVAFRVRQRSSGAAFKATFAMPGRHNVSNALAAVAASVAAGVDFERAIAALSGFAGVKRRFDVIGEAAGVVVIDDFGHNPDKIAATLNTLHEFSGRLLIMFQPHGFGPLKKLKQEFIAGFVDHLAEDDLLFMPEPVYFGGTVDRSVGSAQIVDAVKAAGRRAVACETRAECGDAIVDAARAGDRIVVMGARDDTLTEFAEGLLETLKTRS